MTMTFDDLEPADTTEATAQITLTPGALVIDHLTVRDAELIDALMVWGQSHPQGPEAALTELPRHIAHLLSVGARVSEMGRNSVAAELVTAASRNARDNIGAATAEVSGSVQRVREEMSFLVEQFKTEVRETLDTMLSGDESAVAAMLKTTLRTHTDELAKDVSERIDATVSATLKTGLDVHVTRIEESLGEVRDHLMVDEAVTEASAALSNRSNLKGSEFEDRMNAELETLAAEMSAEYLSTGQTPGALKGEGSQLKGDGVWLRDGAAVVLEYHNGMSRSATAATRADGWTGYLNTAMRNRQASAALGVVLTPDQNKGQVFREFGPNMAVLACDPNNADDLIRLRFVMQVMGLVARNLLPAGASEDGAGSATGAAVGLFPNGKAHLADRLVLDLAMAKRALEDMRSGMENVTEIEKLAAKTSQNALALHERAQTLKMSLTAPLDRAREAMEAQAHLMGMVNPAQGGSVEDDEEVVEEA